MPSIWERIKRGIRSLGRKIRRRVRTIVPSRIIRGAERPGGWLEPSLLATVATAVPKAIAELTGIRLPGAKAAGTVEARETLVPTAGVAKPATFLIGMSTRLTPTEAAKPPAQVPKGPEVAPPTTLKATVPTQTTPTKVAEVREAPGKVAAGREVRAEIPSPAKPAETTGPKIRSVRPIMETPPMGVSAPVPTPAVPAAIVQREEARLPISEVVRKVLEARKIVPEETMVELPMVERIEERARPLRPKRIEDILAELLSR